MDLSGRVFGDLTAAAWYGSYKDEDLWSCRCTCGKECVVLIGRLLDGSVTNCGCRGQKKRKTDITGQRFGKLVAREYLFDDHQNQACWRFQCDCGNTKILREKTVKYGNVRSCGCLRAEKTGGLHRTDITGMVFGRLTAVAPTEKRDATGSVLWDCRCKCGNRCLAPVGALRKGKIKSCGCYYREVRSRCVQQRRDRVEDTSLGQLVASKTPRNDNRSGNTGVYYIDRLGKWESYISYQKKRYHLGIYDRKEDAVKARKQAEMQFHDPVIARNLDRLTKRSRIEFEQYLGSAVLR